jgi:hypothetical protein
LLVIQSHIPCGFITITQKIGLNQFEYRDRFCKSKLSGQNIKDTCSFHVRLTRRKLPYGGHLLTPLQSV